MNTETGLAYIGKITHLDAIENADMLLAATVDCGVGGTWRGVVKRGDVLEGDLVEVYLQDAVLPREARFMFMEARKFRVRICRLRGALSECLVMPLHLEINPLHGTDITDAAGVTKYERKLPADMQGEAKGNFPSFLRKTDEPNVQRSRMMVDALTGQPYVATLKLDGSSVTFYRHEGTFGVCSRRMDLKDGDSAFWKVARKHGLDGIPDGYAVQGELVGPSIQGNPLGLKEPMAFAFNVFHIKDQRYLDHDDAIHFLADHVPAMSWVPVVSMGTEFHADAINVEALKYPNGRAAEGVVIRPMKEYQVWGDRLSFKIINPAYKEAS